MSLKLVHKKPFLKERVGGREGKEKEKRKTETLNKR